jgi:hypothetical protein
MDFKDQNLTKVNVKFELFDAQGNLISMQEVHNAVTVAGRNGIADQLLAAPALAKPTHMELGTSTGGTTKLTAFVSGSRQALSSKTRATNVVTMVANFAAGVGTGSITEAGIFDSATQDGGNMWTYSSFTAIPKGAADTLQITWTLTVN